MRTWLIALVLMSFSLRSHAHPSLHSALALDIKEKTVAGELHVTLSELEKVLGKSLAAHPRDSVDRFQTEISDYVAQHLRVRSVDGTPWVVEVDRHLGVIEKEGAPDVELHLTFIPAPGANLRDFVLESDLILHQVLTHKMFITLRRDWHTGVFEDQAKVIKIIQFLHTSAHVNLTQGSIWRGFLATFQLGMKHIAEGTDHLLFLLMLMLPAVLIAQGRRWGAFRGTRRSLIQLLKIVTAFTAGHSLTLLIGGLDWFHLPPALVESLIAISIMISAVHAFRPIFPEREFWVAAGFGLIHGLAFSSAVAEFHLGTRELLLSILGFNLGIEAMQLGIVAILIPWLMILARDSWYRWLRLGLAAFGGLAALGWLGERSLELVNPMAPAVALAEGFALEFTILLTVSIGLRVFLNPIKTPVLKRK